MTLHPFIPICKVILFWDLTLSGREPGSSSMLSTTCHLTHTDAMVTHARGPHPPQNSA